MTETKLGILRDKLRICNEKYLNKDFLDKLISKFAPNYKIKDLAKYGLISVIKKWKWYLNNLCDNLENPYKIIDLYFDWKNYMFWWLSVYNMYNFSTQIADKFTVYNTSYSWEKKIWPYTYLFKKENPNFFYWAKLENSWPYTYRVMSPERAFIQMLKEKKDFNYLPNNLDKNNLLNLAEKYAPKYVLQKIKKLCL